MSNWGKTLGTGEMHYRAHLLGESEGHGLILPPHDLRLVGQCYVLGCHLVLAQTGFELWKHCSHQEGEK